MATSSDMCGWHNKAAYDRMRSAWTRNYEYQGFCEVTTTVQAQRKTRTIDDSDVYGEEVQSTTRIMFQNRFWTKNLL